MCEGQAACGTEARHDGGWTEDRLQPKQLLAQLACALYKGSTGRIGADSKASLAEDPCKVLSVNMVCNQDCCCK